MTPHLALQLFYLASRCQMTLIFLQSEVIVPNKVFLVPPTYQYLSYIYTYVVAIWFKRTYDVGVYCVIEILILSWKKKVLIPLNTY